MGKVLNAVCKECGFTRNGIYYGQGMQMAPARIPAIQKETGELVVAELSDDPNLRFYHQRAMFKDPINKDFMGENYGHENNDIWLSATGNLCPACHEFSLDFVSIGNWD